MTELERRLRKETLELRGRLHKEIDDLYEKCKDEMVKEYFDLQSDAMLDEKIKVLKALSKGRKPDKIKNYYMILENYKEEN